MNFKKKKNSRNKVFNIIGLILLPIIVVILLESSLNFVSDSENNYEKSSSTSQLQTKTDLLEEQESFEIKKKEDLVSTNKDLEVQNSNAKDVLIRKLKMMIILKKGKLIKRKINYH